MNAPLNPALLAPVVQAFNVKIVFTQGSAYQATVRCADDAKAKVLALIDARMQRYDEPVVSITADRPP